ncbi:hypothetical protein GR925_27340 [Streptomyces sp. HUCO-GS316]|uniref:hypothetical protein n=1 Tax=Streptomyces sp. HUCO-GS316 TaxID=2692198 RepID=UPI00136D8645|nr:hypothetical protein [Streptomyces sp. HUCO-GS316]MXM67043.1 hypothetical protein [Streptomyces sp. HUCO-GS316]
MVKASAPVQARYVRIQDVPVDDLTPYPGNAKRGDIPAILDSLRRNAQYRSVVARETDGTLTVLAGNNTLAALREHGPGDCGVTFKKGRKTLPCGVCSNHRGYVPALRVEVVECDEETARRINLADNKTGALGTWDDEALAALLAGIEDDLTGTGYDSDDYEDLLKATGAFTAPATDFLNDFLPGGQVPAPTATPALHPFSDSAPPPATPQQPPAAAADLEDAPSGAEAPTAPPPHSPGVHTGPEPYTGPGHRSPAGEGAQLPPAPALVPVQWVVSVEQRDTIRAAIKAEQARAGHETAADALTAVCHAYLTGSSEQ